MSSIGDMSAAPLPSAPSSPSPSPSPPCSSPIAHTPAQVPLQDKQHRGHEGRVAVLEEGGALLAADQGGLVGQSGSLGLQCHTPVKCGESMDVEG